MDIQIDKRFDIAASVAQAWTVLSDIRAVAGCMPGASISEQVDDTHFQGTVKSKIGPATMNFAGTVELLALDAAARSLDMLAKGADKAGSSASMKLLARIEPGALPGQSVLVGQATVSVSGKIAQFGNRLLVPVSDALLGQFADNFRAAAVAVPDAQATVAVDPATENTVTRQIQGGQAPGAVAPAPASSPAATRPTAVHRELKPMALLWIAFKSWLARLFGRQA